MICNPLNALAQSFHHTRRERLVDHGTQTPVVRLIQIEHVPLQRFCKTWEPRLLAGMFAVLGEARVLENRDNIVIASDQPSLANTGEQRKLDTADRVLRPQMCIKWERICFELAADEID